MVSNDDDDDDEMMDCCQMRFSGVRAPLQRPTADFLCTCHYVFYFAPPIGAALPNLCMLPMHAYGSVHVQPVLIIILFVLCSCTAMHGRI